MRSLLRLLLSVFLLQLSSLANAATFNVSGTALAINLTAANETVAITAEAASYTFALTGGTWSGTDSAEATGNGTASLSAVKASFTAVTVDDGSTGNAVTFNDSGANSYTSNFTVTLDDATAGTITFNGTTAFTGSATLSASTSRNISVASGAVVSVVNGNLTLSANQQVTARTGTFLGIDLNGGTVSTSGTGAVSLNGRGGSTGDSNFGIQVRAGGRVESTQSTSGAGSLSLNGTGGAGNSANFGLHLTGASSMVTSVVGPISISGSGRGRGTGNYGVTLSDGATLSSTGTSAATAAAITVVGAGTTTASATGTTEHGVMIDGNLSDPLITSVAGNISITGTGGQSTSTGHRGVLLQLGGRIRSTGTGANAATITIVATGGTTGGNNRVGFDMVSASSIASVDGAISITGTAGTGGSGTGQRGISVSGGSSIESTGTGSISLTGIGGTLAADASRFGVQVTGAGSTVKSSTGTGSITMIANSVDLASSGTLDAGANPVSIQPRSNGTAINLGATDTLATPVLGLTDAELDLVTGGTLTIGDSNSGAITVSAVISPASYKTLALGTTTTFAATGGFTADVTSASVYEKLTVTGTVTINAGATLTTNSSGYTWNGSDSFTFLANDSTDAISGTFTTTLTNFLGSTSTAIATYAGGTGNDFVIFGLLSSNANLSGLTLGSGTLNETFASGTLVYTATVASGVSSLIVSPVKADPDASFVITPASPVSLAVGNTVISILVTAEDTVTTKTYTVTVTRPSPTSEWATQNGVSPDLSVVGANGQTNLVNYAFGMNPFGGSGNLSFTGTFATGFSVTGRGLPTAATETSPTSVDMRALYVRRKDAASAGLTYVTEFSSNMTTWEPISSALTVLSDDGTYEVVSMKYPRILSNGRKASFFRVRIILN